MDGEHATGSTESSTILIEAIQINQNKAGLPIMAVDNIRLKSNRLAQFQNAPAEKDKPFRVVEIISLGRAV
jgi:hypothetical protein